MQQLTKFTDSELVAAYANGNNEAFDTLLERHKARLYGYIINIVKDKELAEDIFQETFVKVITTVRQGRYSEQNKFLGWVTRIAHNLIIDYYRAENTMPVVSTDDVSCDLLNRRDLCSGNIEDEIMSIQLDEDLRNLVMALPDSQREVLVMRVYRNMLFKEIAAATNVSINTALGRMRYAILNIRRMAAEMNLSLVV